MIDVSMIDNNLLSINFQPVWLSHLLDVVKHETAEIVKSRNLNFKICPFPGIDQMTFGDGERLLQALRNIISNSIKFTPDGGSITIDGRLLPGFIEMIITDTGIGIDPENHTRIFEKFGHLGKASLHQAGKRSLRAAGLG